MINVTRLSLFKKGITGQCWNDAFRYFTFM